MGGSVYHMEALGSCGALMSPSGPASQARPQQLHVVPTGAIGQLGSGNGASALACETW